MNIISSPGHSCIGNMPGHPHSICKSPGNTPFMILHLHHASSITLQHGACLVNEVSLIISSVFPWLVPFDVLTSGEQVRFHMLTFSPHTKAHHNSPFPELMMLGCIELLQMHVASCSQTWRHHHDGTRVITSNSPTLHQQREDALFTLTIIIQHIQLFWSKTNPMEKGVVHPPSSRKLQPQYNTSDGIYVFYCYILLFLLLFAFSI